MIVSRVILLLLLTSNLLFGQSKPYSRDPNALDITPEQQAMLCGKEWWCIKKREVRRERSDERAIPLVRIELSSDGTYTTAGVSEGRWTVGPNNVIEFSGARNPRYDRPILGAFSIYEIQDTLLVLNQKLTSTGDWFREYTFTTTRRYATPTWLFSYCQHANLKDGSKVSYHPNGAIQRKENYALVRKKVSAEDIFLANGKLGPCVDPTHSTYAYSFPTGEWISYYPDGKIESRLYYDSEGFQDGRMTTFSSDGRIRLASVYDHGQMLFFDEYDYSNASAFPLITRTVGKNQYFVIGRKDSVQFDRLNFIEIGKAGSAITDTLRVKNLTDHVVSFGFPSGDIELDGYASATIPLTFTLVPDASEGSIQCKSAEWVIDLRYRSIGYHITRTDFEQKQILELPSTFYFYKISDEHTLEIAGVKSVPISKQLSEIRLKRGRYRLVLTGQSWTKELEVHILRN